MRHPSTKLFNITLLCAIGPTRKCRSASTFGCLWMNGVECSLLIHKPKLTRLAGILKCVLLFPPSMILRYPSAVCFPVDVDRFGFLTQVAPRMWALSLLCALFGSSSNLFFSLRYPSVFISPVIALVIVHPLGRAWDILLKRDGDPVEVFDHGVRNESMTTSGFTSRMQYLRLWLAQGKWNEKEHACVYIASNVSFGFAFATDVRTL